MNRQEIPKIMLTSNGYDGATVMSAKLKETIDGMPSLELEVAVTLDTALYVKEENIIGFSDKLISGWRFFVIKEITVLDDIHARKMLVYCEDYALELIDNICRVELKGDTYSVLSKLNRVLAGTRWAVNPSNPPDDPPHIKFPQETKNKSVLEVLQMMSAEYGLHLAFVIQYFDGAIQNRYVTLKAEIGQDNGMVFDYNHNVASIERVIDSTDVKTAIIPVGGVPANSPKDTPPIDIKNVVWSTPTNPANKPSGQDYLIDTTATDLWGFSNPNGTKFPRYIYYQNSNITDPADLIQDAWNQLQLINAPMINYKMTVIDLFALSGYDYANNSDLVVRLGDIVTVVDRSFLFDYVITTHVISREVDLLDVGSTVLELGSFVKSVVSTTSNLSSFASSAGTVMKVSSDLAQLQNNVTVLTSDVANLGTVTIEDASITTAKIADASITTAKIANLAVDFTKIQDATITTAKIGDAQITNAKIDRVSAGKLVVTSADIADATIGTAQIELGAITNALISSEAVGTAQIANGSITDAKIVELTANKITSGELSTERLIIRDPLDPSKSLIYSINSIDGALQAIQGDTLNGEVLTERTITADKIVANAITANEIASKTITANEILAGTITASEIASGTITATQIASGAITADKLTAGTIQTMATHIIAPCPSGLVDGGYLAGTTHSLLLTVTEVIHLGKCKVYADVAGSMVVNLYNNTSGALVETRNFPLVVGENILNLNWVLDPSVAGTYRINGVTATSKLWRNNVGVSFPYDGGSFQVNYFSSNLYYYFFYDMEISGIGVKGRLSGGTTISGDSITSGTISGVTINAKSALGVSSNIWNAGTDNGLKIGDTVSGYGGPATLKLMQGLTGDGSTTLTLDIINGGFDINAPFGVWVTGDINTTTGRVKSRSLEVGTTGQFKISTIGYITAPKITLTVDPTWTVPTLGSGWSQFAGQETFAYYKDGFGFVHFKGSIKGGTFNTDIFVLPISCRPYSGAVHGAIVSDSGGDIFGSVYVGPTGNVRVGKGTNTIMSFDGFSFYAGVI